jgi:hypothetical protein
MEDESSGYTIRKNISRHDQRLSVVVSRRNVVDALRKD